MISVGNYGGWFPHIYINISTFTSVLLVLSSVVCLSSCLVPTSEFYHENSSRSLYNVILCRLPGGARQYPRSGYFLVNYVRVFCRGN